MKLSRGEFRIIKQLLNLAEEHDLDMLIDDTRTFKHLRDRFNNVVRQTRQAKAKRLKYKNSQIKFLRRRIG